MAVVVSKRAYDSIIIRGRTVNRKSAARVVIKDNHIVDKLVGLRISELLINHRFRCPCSYVTELLTRASERKQKVSVLVVGKRSGTKLIENCPRALFSNSNVDDNRHIRGSKNVYFSTGIKETVTLHDFLTCGVELFDGRGRSSL